MRARLRSSLVRLLAAAPVFAACHSHRSFVSLSRLAALSFGSTTKARRASRRARSPCEAAPTKFSPVRGQAASLRRLDIVLLVPRMLATLTSRLLLLRMRGDFSSSVGVQSRGAALAALSEALRARSR